MHDLTQFRAPIEFLYLDGLDTLEMDDYMANLHEVARDFAKNIKIAGDTIEGALTPKPVSMQATPVKKSSKKTPRSATQTPATPFVAEVEEMTEERIKTGMVYAGRVQFAICVILS